MSLPSELPSDWLNRFTDSFAVLGIALTADDRRIQKRYRKVAMLLHPDRYIQADTATQQFTSQMLSRLINPNYDKLSQERHRKETLAFLRLKVRQQLRRESALQPQSQLARQLVQRPVADVDTFYEQAVSQLAEAQYEPLTPEQYESVTQQLSELNLVYLKLKLGDAVIPQSRPTGLVAAKEAKPLQFTPANKPSEAASETYDRRHFRRAKEYAKRANWEQAIQELRDALRLNPNSSDYHAWLGVCFLMRNQPADAGMARVHLRQALKIEPTHKFANQFAKKAGVDSSVSTNGTRQGKSRGKPPAESAQPSQQQRGGLFGWLRPKKSLTSPKKAAAAGKSTPRSGLWRWLVSWGKRLLKLLRKLGSGRSNFVNPSWRSPLANSQPLHQPVDLSRR